MQFFLQQGHGMRDLDLQFARKYAGIGVILSPRACQRERLERHASELSDLGAEVLFDPQFYDPHTQREKVLSYPYWGDVPFSTVEFDAAMATRMCRQVIEYQIRELGTSTVMLPGRYTNVASDAWLEMQYAFAACGSAYRTQCSVISTLAIGPDVISQNDMLDKVLNEVVQYPVDGIYLVAVPPTNEYLVSSMVYLSNLLDGLLSLSLAGKAVIVGYANQQALLTAASGVVGLASGNYRNVRSFDPSMFGPPASGPRQRSVWYYHPQSLSEFNAPQLDIAYRSGLSRLFPSNCEHCSPLLSARIPSSVPWGEPSAFRHYLVELRQQWLAMNGLSLSQRLQHLSGLVTTADRILSNMRLARIPLGDKSYRDSVEPTKNALSTYQRVRAADIATYDRD